MIAVFRSEISNINKALIFFKINEEMEDQTMYHCKSYSLVAFRPNNIIRNILKAKQKGTWRWSESECEFLINSDSLETFLEKCKTHGVDFTLDFVKKIE